MSKKYKFLYYQLNKRVKVVVAFLTGMMAVNYSSFSQIQFGLEGGAGVSQMPVKVEGTANGYPINEDYIDQLPRWAFYFGGFGNVQLNDLFSVRSKLYFSNKGTIEKVDRFGSNKEIYTVKTNINLNYIGMAMMGDLLPINKLAIGIGPSIEFLMTVKEKNELSSKTSKDNYSKANLGARLSATYFLTSKIGCGLEGEFGINKTYQLEVDGYLVEYSFTRGMRGVYLTIDYRIN